MEKPIGVTLHHAEIFEIETAARDAGFSKPSKSGCGKSLRAKATAE